MNYASCCSSLRERLFFGDVQREAQLRHEDAAGAHQHRLLARRESLGDLAQREVPHDFGDLVDVAALQLLLVVLEPPAPVGGLADVLLGEQLEEVVDVLDRDRRPHPDVFGLVRRHREGQVTVGDPEHEVFGLLAERLAHLLALDHGGPVMGVHDPVTDFERHATP